MNYLSILINKKTLNRTKQYFISPSARTLAIFTSGNFVVAIVSAFSGLLYAHWVEPGVLGEFRKYSILTGYLGLGIVFVDGAFQRHFPYFLGKKQKDEALNIASYVKWWYLMLMWVGSLIFGILTIENLFKGNYRASIGWFVQIPAYFAMYYGLFLKVLYRSNNDFRLLNKNMLISAGFAFILLPLVYFYKYWGLASRFGMQNFINFILHLKNAPFKVKAKFNKKELINIFKISLPIQIPSYIDTYLLKSTISLIILTNLGQHALGIYGMAITLQGFLLVFSRSINQIFTTKIMLNYGSHENINKSFKYIIKPTIYAIIIGLVIVVLVISFTNIFLIKIIPKYIESLPVFKILSFEMVFSLARAPFTIFISALLLKEIIWLRIFKTFFCIGLILILEKSVVNIAWSIIFSGILYIIVGYFLLFIKMKNIKDYKNGNY